MDHMTWEYYHPSKTSQTNHQFKNLYSIYLERERERERACGYAGGIGALQFKASQNNFAHRVSNMRIHVKCVHMLFTIDPHCVK